MARKVMDCPFIEKLSLEQSLISSLSPIPNSKQEAWKYFSPEDLLAQSFPLTSSLTCSEKLNPLADEFFVFINGKFDEQQSLLKKLHFEKKKFQSPIAKNFFCEINFHLCGDGIVLDIPPRFLGSVHIVHVNSEDGAFIPSSLTINVGEYAQCSLIQEFRGLGSSYFSHNALKINVNRHSSVDFIYLQDNSLDSYHLSYIDVDQKRDSSFNSYSLQWGGKKTRQDLLVKLDEENAKAHSYGLYLAGKSQVVDNRTQLKHLVEKTNSKQHYKGIVANFGRAIFNGKIYVAPDAQDVDSSQLNNNLLLGPNARIDTKPEIEVFANNIACTHGATIGRFDEKQLFYLLTRCIDKKDAQTMLLSAFIEEIILQIKHKPILNYLQKRLYSYVSTLEIETQLP